MRREVKSLRIGVHHANAVVWGPVYRTRLYLRRQRAVRVHRRLREEREVREMRFRVGLIIRGLGCMIICVQSVVRWTPARGSNGSNRRRASRTTRLRRPRRAAREDDQRRVVVATRVVKQTRVSFPLVTPRIVHPSQRDARHLRTAVRDDRVHRVVELVRVEHRRRARLLERVPELRHGVRHPQRHGDPARAPRREHRRDVLGPRAREDADAPADAAASRAPGRRGRRGVDVGRRRRRRRPNERVARAQQVRVRELSPVGRHDRDGAGVRDRRADDLHRRR